jgi:tRNA (mo5U34)-methyltransferase
LSGGTVLLETSGVGPEDRNGPAIRVSEPGEVYARDEFVYWGFGDAGLQRIAQIAGFSHVESLVDVEVDGHPRIMGRLVA